VWLFNTRAVADDHHFLLPRVMLHAAMDICCNRHTTAMKQRKYSLCIH
jgi:hypothetical protein